MLNGGAPEADFASLSSNPSCFGGRLISDCRLRSTRPQLSPFQDPARTCCLKLYHLPDSSKLGTFTMIRRRNLNAPSTTNSAMPIFLPDRDVPLQYLHFLSSTKSESWSQSRECPLPSADFWLIYVVDSKQLAASYLNHSQIRSSNRPTSALNLGHIREPSSLPLPIDLRPYPNHAFMS